MPALSNNLQTRTHGAPEMSGITATGNREKRTPGRYLALCYSLAILTGLAALAVLYMKHDLVSILPLSIPMAVLACAWAGALGGVAISLKGVSNHPAKRDPGRFINSQDDEVVRGCPDRRGIAAAILAV